MKNGLKNKKVRQGKISFLEVLVSVLLLIVFVLVVITGVLSHQRLNYIIDTVKTAIRPDRKLILVKEINNNLTEAENSVKSFSLTRSSDYLVRFYELTENTGLKFDELYELVSPRDPLNPYIDTLNTLVGEKFTILDRLLSIQDEFRVQQAMQQVVKSIREHELANTGTLPESSPVITDSVDFDTIISEVPAKKENFFARLFRKKNKSPRDKQDTIIKVQAPDTIFVSNQPPTGVSIEEISEKVSQVQEEVVSRDRRLRQEEWKLLQEDKEVMKKIRQLISYLEEKEIASQLVVTKDAETKAAEVRFIIMAFGLTASVFIFLAALVIYGYVKRNNEYKAVLLQARKDAEELAKAKEMFLANMSHEIRTPMNIISGFLAQVLKEPMDERQLEQLLIIKKSSDHLLQLLNDLLDLSKLQADKLELVETNYSPAEIVNEVHLLLEPASSAKNLRFLAFNDPGLPPLVYGDPVRLRQILFNLVSNAIKFTDHGTVTISSFALEVVDKKAVLAFEITDTGVGISEEELGKIFHAFEKASSRPGSNTEGAGLGLSITKKLVSLLHGNIHVESKPDAGTKFRIEIPCITGKEDSIPEIEKIPLSTGHFRDLNILVVDDDEYNRRLARLILEKYDCRVSESGTAEDAIELVEKSDIDLVLMDIHLPGMNGPEAASLIKQIGGQKGSNIPVIAVSATISKGDLERFRQSGLDDFILKPYKEEMLVEMISRYTGKSMPVDLMDNPGSMTAPDDLYIPGDEFTPEYDLGPLKVSSGGNEAFFHEMVNLFLENNDNGIAALKQLIENKEWEEASALAHKLISPCRHLKAIKLSQVLKLIENNGEEPAGVDSAEELINQARTEFDRIKADIIQKNEL
jgi:signal transduction histidine kinase/DNA-binding response OmpR family regulator